MSFIEIFGSILFFAGAIFAIVLFVLSVMGKITNTILGRCILIVLIMLILGLLILTGYANFISTKTEIILEYK